MSVLSGWCGQHGKPAHQWCRSLVCSCEACGHPWRKAKTQATQGFVRDLADGSRDNTGGAESTLATALDTSTDTTCLRGSARRGR